MLAVHGRGRFVGDLSMLTGQAVYVTAVAQTDVEVLEIPFDRLKEAVTQDQALGDLILRAFILRRNIHANLGAGLRIIGSRYSADTRRLRDFASRNRIPYRWDDLEEDPEAEATLRAFGIPPDQTPVVIWKGQTVLRNPSNTELAELLGLRAAPSRAAYDLIVVGAGPAGLAAAVTPRQKVSRPSFWTPSPPAARRPRRPRSRTTSASRRASPAPNWPTAP